MCGIVGYIGTQPVVPILLSGLERLEYRGYDSAGIAVLSGEEIEIRKAKGRLNNLRQLIEVSPCAPSTVGIGHTRWATHGEPSDLNAHPHTDALGSIAIIHNGIIENYLQLKQELQAEGVPFVSETDSEVIVHLLHRYYKGDMLEALYRVLPLLRGSFALGVLTKDQPDRLYCTRKDSPLVVGRSSHGCFMASDIPAMLEYSRDVYLLEDLDVAVLTRDAIQLYSALGTPIEREMLHVDWDVKVAERAGYAHFMLKEIHDEPDALRDTLNPHLDADAPCLRFRSESMPFTAQEAKAIQHITILACGTAYHAGLVACHALETLARVPSEAQIASEYRYRDVLTQPGTLAVVISQSGETADTIAAMREAKRKGCKVLAICNVVGSTVAREADQVLYTWAGPEIAVASTKAYVSQLMLLYLVAIDLAEKRGMLSPEAVAVHLGELAAMPEKVASVIEQEQQVRRFAHHSYDRKSVFFIGRGLDYAQAQEASLKLKEVSYIHSEAYAAGELKHGTIALIEPGTLVVALATQPQLIEKTVSGIKEVKVRGAHVLAVASRGEHRLDAECDEVWSIPEAMALYAPILAIPLMQMLAYAMALEKGCDVDKPRNLAKSVTVE